MVKRTLALIGLVVLIASQIATVILIAFGKLPTVLFLYLAIPIILIGLRKVKQS